MGNPFQNAVRDLNLAITGHPDEETLTALGGCRFMRFTKGTGKTVGKDCTEDDDAERPMTLKIVGFDPIEGKNLDDVVAQAKARISPAPAAAVPAAKPAARRRS